MLPSFEQVECFDLVGRLPVDVGLTTWIWIIIIKQFTTSAAEAKYGSVGDNYLLELKLIPSQQLVLGNLFAVKLKNKNKYVYVYHDCGEVQ